MKIYVFLFRRPKILQLSNKFHAIYLRNSGDPRRKLTLEPRPICQLHNTCLHRSSKLVRSRRCIDWILSIDCWNPAGEAYPAFWTIFTLHGSQKESGIWNELRVFSIDDHFGNPWTGCKWDVFCNPRYSGNCTFDDDDRDVGWIKWSSTEEEFVTMGLSIGDGDRTEDQRCHKRAPGSFQVSGLGLEKN